MKLKIRGVRAAGDIEHERVVIEALEDTDIGFYIVLAARYGEEINGPLGAQVPFCYWLPNKEVKKGDLIVVYTKSGKRSVKSNSSGNKSYFFYWELSNSVWTQQTVFTLVAASEWEFAFTHEKAAEEEVPDSGVS